VEIINKNILVTGAAKRIGHAIAIHLASLGANIAVHYNTSEKDALTLCNEISAMKRISFPVKADLLKSDEIKKMFSRILDEFGSLHVLVNSAAVFRRTPKETLSEEDFDYHINTNLKGTYLCCISAAGIMSKSGGRIINIADIAAFRPYSGYIPYCVSKAGIVSLTQSMALAFAPKILVNAIAPSHVLSRENEEGEMERIVQKIPLKRTGTPDDVAKTVAFLIESDFITGAVIPVDGGRMLL
jgi:NAD(P)-dependent dehydrogenase (short-subunit alcohol dehydrogenase family)